MADINSGSGSGHSGTRRARSGNRGAATEVPRHASEQAGADDEALIGIVELLFFAYRDFTGEADAVLQEIGFGRAHHRVLHFVNRRPGLRVADLLDILRITKQSLARVLKQLVDRGFIAQSAGDTDRRERRLFLTPKGIALAAKLARLQVAQIGQALSSVGSSNASGSATSVTATRDPSGSDPSGSDGDAARRFLYDFLVAMIGAEQRATIAAAIAASTPLGEPGAMLSAGSVSSTRDKSVT